LRKRWLALALLLVLVTIPLVLLTSESALREVAKQIEARVPGLELADVRGRLAGGVSIARVSWRAGDDTVVTIDELDASWRLLPALMGRAHITDFRAEKVTLVLRATDTHANEASPVAARDEFRMPLPLR